MTTGSGPGGRAAAGPSRPGYPQPRRRRLILLKGLLVLLIAAVLVDLVRTQWIFHISDRFTPLTEWDGYGTVRASNGGRYVLFTLRCHQPVHDGKAQSRAARRRTEEPAKRGLPL